MTRIAPIATAAVFLLPLLGAGACNGSLRFDEADAEVEATVPGDGGAQDARTGTCTSDVGCSHGLHCEESTQKCVACTTDAHCGGTRPHCEPVARQCVECLASTDCGSNQICEQNAHRCLDACKKDNDPCPIAGQVCHDDQGICVECFRDNQCSANSASPHCDTPVGRCVGCRGAADCHAGRPVCDRRDGTCVECMNSTECPVDRPVCDPTTRACVN